MFWNMSILGGGGDSEMRMSENALFGECSLLEMLRFRIFVFWRFDVLRRKTHRKHPDPTFSSSHPLPVFALGVLGVCSPRWGTIYMDGGG